MAEQVGKLNGNTGKKLQFTLFALVVFFPATAWSQQPKLELSTDYSYLRTNSSGGGGSFSANGGSVSLAWNVKPRLSLVADFAGYNLGSESAGVSGRMFTYALGPRISPRSEHSLWRPFGQLLFGVGRVSGYGNGQSAGENGFAMIVGGGLDARLGPSLAIRCLDVDYLMTTFNRSNGMTGVQNDLRVSTGIVYRFNFR